MSPSFREKELPEWTWSLPSAQRVTRLAEFPALQPTNSHCFLVLDCYYSFLHVRIFLPFSRLFRLVLLVMDANLPPAPNCGGDNCQLELLHRKMEDLKRLQAEVDSLQSLP